MPSHNFAAYKPGTFATDISNLDVNEGFFEKKDIPAFVHEYCHYIQDISTISSIFGFSLLMRDIVALTQIFSDGENKIISIPLEKDHYGETINKYRKYYNLYCGDSNDVFNLDYSKHSFIKRHLMIQDIDLDGRKQKLALNHIEISQYPNKLFFGLIVLQEIHAYYAQQLAELKLPSEELSIYTKELPSYPYKFGDFLFNEFKIDIDIASKFILIDLCLDTMQATSVFLEVLDALKDKTISYFGSNKADFVAIVEAARQKCSYSTEVALENILPDLKMWSKDPGRKYLAESLVWYVNQVELIYNLKKIVSPTIFSMSFTMDWENFALLFKCFPSPAYLRNDILFRNFSLDGEEEEDNEFIKNFEAATTIWSHKIIYDLLCSETIDQIKKRCECPLYDNCHLRPQIGEDYICKTSPWEIIKNADKLVCQYGMASHSFGLWQNTLDIKID